MKIILSLIIILLPLSTKAELSCYFPDKDNKNVMFSPSDNCGYIEGDKLKLKKAFLDKIHYDKNNLACLLYPAKEGTFYIHKSGVHRRVYYYDTSCDLFKDGLARGIVNKKMVFINKNLDVVLSPNFDFLGLFDYGHAVVCNGPFQEEIHGEHTVIKGGKCGLIDKQGKLVVEAVHRLEDYQVFRSYINHNNHCDRPPINSEKSALCHAKRHVSNMNHHTDKWKWYEISRHDKFWLISFIENGDMKPEFTLTLNSNNAHWKSLIIGSKKEALKRLKNE